MTFPRRLPALVIAVLLSACAATAAAPAPPSPSTSVAVIPGPLRSFLRMAGISQKVTPDEVLPLLARNAVVLGWERESQPTEFLLLLRRYVDQSRELRALAGAKNSIDVERCEDVKPLLDVLGYRLREGCGKNAALETSVPERAFVTLDSGFPLAKLEEALRTGQPFRYPYPDTPVPMLFTSNDWAAASRTGLRLGQGNLLDDLLRDPSLARLYWGMSKADVETRELLRQSPGLSKLLPVAGVMDFFGSYIAVRGGKVVAPGGAAAETQWKELAGADVHAPSDFVPRLLAKDNGWLAAYFDALSRADDQHQAYFCDPRRLRKFYEGVRGKDVGRSPATPVFRPDGGLLLLVSRLQLENGQPRIPGGLAVWKEILRRRGGSGLIREWAGKSQGWSTPDQLVEGLFGLSRIETADGPLQTYLAINEVDRGRTGDEHLSAATVRLLADKYSRFGHQYTLLAEFHGLNNASIARYFAVADSLDHISDPFLRADVIGTFQATLGLWQILARQGQLPPARMNDAFQRAMAPLQGVKSGPQLFDAARTALSEVVRAAGAPDLYQDNIIALLAGPQQSTPEGQRMRSELAVRMHTVMQDQRLVSLDTLFALGDGLAQLSQGKASADALLPLAAELREFEFPRSFFSNTERIEYAPGLPDYKHTALQTRMDLSKVIRNPSPKELAEARGLLSALLRDTLVGLNYAYYEPPAAQVLHHNPLFIRSHDFSGSASETLQESWKTPRLFGSGVTAGRGAHLVGSLAHLPFVLSQVEQDFIVPENVQALIWDETVPALVTSAILPRWWTVSRQEMHAVALHQRAGDELVRAAVTKASLRAPVVDILSERMLPQRCAQIERALAAGNQDALPELMPGETLYLAAEFRRRYPGQSDAWASAGKELEELARQYPADASWARLSEDFGVPHPALQQSYARALLNIKPFPAVGGYGSRLMAESWDSSNLYWARLADELGYAPVMLNRLVPELTRRMVEKIFATDFEDFSALMRAMRETGEEFRQGKIEAAPSAGAAAQAQQ